MILVDSGFFVALASRRDNLHQTALATATRFREPWVTTWPVMTEVCYFLVDRLGPDAESSFLRSIRAGAASVLDLAARDLERMADLVDQYRDLPMDLADASLVVAAEKLGTGRILSTDERDFSAYRWKRHRPFENLFTV